MTLLVGHECASAWYMFPNYRENIAKYTCNCYYCVRYTERTRHAILDENVRTLYFIIKLIRFIRISLMTYGSFLVNFILSIDTMFKSVYCIKYFALLFCGTHILILYIFAHTNFCKLHACACCCASTPIRLLDYWRIGSQPWQTVIHSFMAWVSVCGTSVITCVSSKLQQPQAWHSAVSTARRVNKSLPCCVPERV